MKLFSIIIADKLSGNTLHTKNYGLFEKEAAEMLFSSVMSGIQHLMTEIKVGTVKTITTEEFQITGEPSSKFILFAIGIFENIDTISNYLVKLGNLLDSWEDSRIISGLHPFSISLLEAMIEQFFSLWTKYNIISGIFVYNNRFGFQSINQVLDRKSEALLTGYLSSLPLDKIDYDHSFFEILPTGGSILAILVNRNMKKLVLYYYFDEMNMRNILSNKQTFINKGMKFIEKHADQIIINEFISEDLSEHWDLFITELQDAIRQYQPSIDFIETNVEKLLFSNHLPFILEAIMLGKPIAVICDTYDAPRIIDLLLYLSGTASAAIIFDQKAPQRITWCNTDNINQLNEFNYQIFDINSNKIHSNSNANLSYFYKIWQKINQSNKDYKDKIYEIRTLCLKLWDKANQILVASIYDPNPKDRFKIITDKKERKFVKQMFYWINPHILKNNDYVVISDEYYNW